MRMELAGLPGKKRAEPVRQPSGLGSLKTYYKSVCECEQRASERNTSLLADLSRLRQKLQLAKDNTSNHMTRFTSLKCHYEAYVASAHTEWVKLTAQQISATARRHDDRQPDPLIASIGAQRPHPPLSGHTPIAPPSAPIASSTMLEPCPLASLEATTTTTREQSALLLAKPILPSQQNNAIPTGTCAATAPSSLAELGPGVSKPGPGVSIQAERKPVFMQTERRPVFIQTERRPVFIQTERRPVFIQTERKPESPADQNKAVQIKNGGLMQAETERQTTAVRERTSMERDREIQTTAVDEEGGKIISLSTSKEEMGESGTLAGEDDRPERGVELPRPYSTDPEQLLEEIGLSSLSPSPSHSHSVNLSPTIEQGVVNQSAELLSTEQDGLLTEDLSVSHDDLSVESVSASDSRAPSPRDVEARGREEGEGEGYSMPDISMVKVKEKSSFLTSPPQPSAPQPPARDSSLTTTPAAESAPDTPPPPPLSQNIHHLSSAQPAIATSQQDQGRVASPGSDRLISTTEQEDIPPDGDAALLDSLSLSVSSTKQTSPAGSLSHPLTASQEHDHHQIIPSDDRGTPLLEDHLPTPSDDTLSESDDRASSVGDAPAGTSSALTGKALETVVLRLLSTLNQHLSIDAESADLMYSVPSGSDNMKSQINSSGVLEAKLTKMAAAGKDVSTWEPGAVSVVLMQQLSHMTNSMGGMLPQQLLEKDVPLLTSCEELSGHMTQQWSAVWPLLLENIQLLSRCGRSLTELAATLTPALVAPGNPAYKEKARLQLLSILQGKVDRSSPKTTRVEREPPSLSEASSPELSLREEVMNDGGEREEDGGGLEMAMTVFGAGEDDISELLSEGSAITEVERELRGETTRGRLQQLQGRAAERVASQRQLTNVNSSPLHLHPSPSNDDDGDASDSESDSTSQQSSPGYIPTALQQRNSVITSPASHHSSLHRRIGLGLLSESESDGSGLDDSLHPPTTPLNNQPSNKMEQDLELEDFDFYD